MLVRHSLYLLTKEFSLFAKPRFLDVRFLPIPLFLNDRLSAANEKNFERFYSIDIFHTIFTWNKFLIAYSCSRYRWAVRIIPAPQKKYFDSDRIRRRRE